mmetsp:Transcript_29/g.34  ORF Transcript_29/g.34 Transcript_29/m.34 type:complete len:394 (-) Transcript_29:48-1229(-)
MMSDYIPKSDIEQSKEIHRSEQDLIHSFGSGLENVSKILDGLETDGTLGLSIRRYAADLANTVKNVALDLECGNNDEERGKFAQALLYDAKSQLEMEHVKSDSFAPAHADSNKSAAAAMVDLSEGDVIVAMNTAREILLDIEDVLRDISEDDAEEIADVGLTVAKMFLWALQNVQKQLLVSSHDSRQAQNSFEIEFLDEDINDCNANPNSSDRHNVERDPSRLRVLWPPIGPAVLSAASWGQEEAMKNPILSVGLAMALWPTALVASFVGVPILCFDWALQSGYDALQGQDVIVNIEKGASNLWQVGRLYFLVSKLVIKKSIRVGKRQIERKGGVGQVMQQVGDWTVDRVTHPVETAGMAWNSLKWGYSVVSDAACVIKNAALNQDDVSVNLM